MTKMSRPVTWARSKPKRTIPCVNTSSHSVKGNNQSSHPQQGRGGMRMAMIAAFWASFTR